MEIARAMPHQGADGVVLVQIAALIPPVVAAAWIGGLPFLGVLLASVLVACAWDYIFATLRQRPLKFYGITTAAIFALIVPPEIPLWHLVVVLSLGTVVGEHVFGGRGFAFLSPATTALAFGILSLPNMALSVPEPAIALACLPGALLLLAYGLLSVSVSLTFWVVLLLFFGATTPGEVVGILSASALGFVFLVGDPTSAAVTGLGRVLHGALAGGLAWVLSGTAAITPVPEALVFAALMASLFAPLFDTIAIALNTIWRRRRYG